ncbi:MAG: N-acetylmannosamine-6-phosphate 2-epimerase [Negativicutes bacterium]
MLEQIRGKLVVSCQALADEPLHSSFVMGRMALAAKEGGAAAIRAQGVSDILEIRRVTGLPVIGLIKRRQEDSPVYITPTAREVTELLATPCEMVALDATHWRRSGEAAELMARIHGAGRLALADVATYEEGLEAVKAGADAVSTALAGYTEDSPLTSGPDLALVERLVAALPVPVLAEGRIASPEDLRRAMAAGAWAAVVGSAITRPQLITAEFARALMPPEARS